MSLLAPALVYIDADQMAGGAYVYRKPHFDVARERGWTCIALTNSNNANLADISTDADRIIEMADFESQTVSGTLLDLAGSYHIAALMFFPGQCPPQGDLGEVVETAAALLGLPFIPAQALTLCNNKFLMRRKLEWMPSDAPPVAAWLINDADDVDKLAGEIRFPVIAKPPFGAGSLFIKRCTNAGELKAQQIRYRERWQDNSLAVNFGNAPHAFVDARRERHEFRPGVSLLVEDYIEGREGSVECVVYQGRVYPLIVQEKLLLSEGVSTIFEHQLVTPPVSFSGDQVAAIRRYAIDCLTTLGIDNSIVHMEFRMTDAGPKAIEINPRLGGFYVNRAFQDIAGLNPYALNLDMLSGSLDPDVLLAAADRVASAPDYFTMFVLYAPRSGYLRTIVGVDEATCQCGMLAHFIDRKDRFYDVENEENYIAKFWGTAGSAREVSALYESVCAQVQIEMTTEAC